MSDHAVVYTHEILTHRCVFERHLDTFFLKVPSRVVDVLESVFIDTIPRCATGIAHQSISFLTVVLLVAEINSFCIEYSCIPDSRINTHCTSQTVWIDICHVRASYNNVLR